MRYDGLPRLSLRNLPLKRILGRTRPSDKKRALKTFFSFYQVITNEERLNNAKLRSKEAPY